jgi:hypothetical protein
MRSLSYYMRPRHHTYALCGGRSRISPPTRSLQLGSGTTGIMGAKIGGANIHSPICLMGSRRAISGYPGSVKWLGRIGHLFGLIILFRDLVDRILVHNGDLSLTNLGTSLEYSGGPFCRDRDILTSFSNKR